jgi:hypothetical protein
VALNRRRLLPGGRARSRLIGSPMLPAVPTKGLKQLDRVTAAILVRPQRPNHHQELGDTAYGHTSTADKHADLNHTTAHPSSPPLHFGALMGGGTPQTHHISTLPPGGRSGEREELYKRCEQTNEPKPDYRPPRIRSQTLPYQDQGPCATRPAPRREPFGCAGLPPGTPSSIRPPISRLLRLYTDLYDLRDVIRYLTGRQPAGTPAAPVQRFFPGA